MEYTQTQVKHGHTNTLNREEENCVHSVFIECELCVTCRIIYSTYYSAKRTMRTEQLWTGSRR
jgi:hypothetical protein